MLLLGIDAGNYNGKVVGPYGVDNFRTALAEYSERNVVEAFGNDDMVFEINGRKGFAGTLAVYENEFGASSLFGDNKAHADTKIRVLLALYRYLRKYAPFEDSVKLVVGQPIVSHKAPAKTAMIELLCGVHNYTVNGESQRVTIEDVRVAPEGSGAYWSDPRYGTVRIIDVGSGTVNAATIVDKRHINHASTTLNFGVETVTDSVDLAGMARAIIRATSELKWRATDGVFICGGIAEEILPYIVEHYSNASVLTPQYRQLDGSALGLSPMYANAVGFYELAKLAYR